MILFCGSDVISLMGEKIIFVLHFVITYKLYLLLNMFYQFIFLVSGVKCSLEQRRSQLKTIEDRIAK